MDDKLYDELFSLIASKFSQTHQESLFDFLNSLFLFNPEFKKISLDDLFEVLKELGEPPYEGN